MPEFDDLPIVPAGNVFRSALISPERGGRVLEALTKAHEIDPTETGTGRRVLTPRDARVLYLALTARR